MIFSLLGIIILLVIIDVAKGSGIENYKVSYKKILLFVVISLLSIDAILIITNLIQKNYLSLGSVADWLSGLATLMAVLYAIYEDKIQLYLNKPKIKIYQEILSYDQGPIKVYRATIENVGNAEINKITFEIKGIVKNDEERSGFLPAPMSITHSKDEYKSLMPGQIMYLDVVREEKCLSPSSGGKYLLYSPILIECIRDLVILDNSIYILKFQYFSKNGLSGFFDISATIENDEISKIEVVSKT